MTMADFNLNRNALKSWLNRLNGTAESISSTKLAKLMFNVSPQDNPTTTMTKICGRDLYYFWKNHGPEFEVVEVPTRKKEVILTVRRVHEVEHK